MQKLWIVLLFISTGLMGCGKAPKQGGPPAGDFPVQVVGAPAKHTNLVESVHLVGSFEAPERLDVLSEIVGNITELPVKEGSFVKQGGIIARIDAAKIEARMNEVRSRAHLAGRNHARSVALRKTETISEQELDDAKAQLDQAQAQLALLEAELDDAVIKASIDGYLGEHRVSLGQVVQPGQILFELIQLDTLNITFNVPERYVPAIKRGLNVQIKSPMYPRKRFNGVVTFLAPIMDSATRTLTVKAAMDNVDLTFRPGMFGQVELILSEHLNALTVPEAAVMQRGKVSFVMTPNAEGRAEMRPVQVGLRRDGWVEILDGLAVNDPVVVEGLIKIWPGALLAFSEDSRRYGLEPSPPPEPATDPLPKS